MTADGEGTGERHTLLLATGKLPWEALAKPLESHQFHHFGYAPITFVRRHFAQTQAKSDIVGD